MTSIGPNTTSLLNTHMYEFVNKRPCVITKKKYNINSLMGIIDRNPDFSIFSYIVKLAKLDNMFDNTCYNYTIFIPSDNLLCQKIKNMVTNFDISTARQIVLASTLKNKITYELLEDDPASYYITLNPVQKMYITNINGNMSVNVEINVIYKDITATNGIIHVTDNLILPYLI
jgi:uncharacterized surface protein with fasciclin (FAS1) repeats